MNDFLRTGWEVARKEILQHFRTKRLLIIGALLVLSLVLITLVFGPRILRGFDLGEAGVAGENFALLIYFSTFFVGGYFFIQLLAIVLTSDAVCSEWSSRTIFLLLSKPVARSAFVFGKFLGSFLTVAGTLVVLFSLDYAFMQGVYEGAPTAAEVGGFFGALGILVLGAAAFSSLALFFSTLSRSTVMSLLFTLGAWIIVFPLVAQIGLFSSLADRGFDGDLTSPQVDWSRYLSPGAAMGVAGKALVTDDGMREALDFVSSAPAHTGWAIFALVVHTFLWFGLSFLIVQRRNFE